MPVVRIPLVGSPHSRIAIDADTQFALSTLDQRFINILFKKETNPITGAVRVRAFKRPGLGNTGATVATVTGQALGASATKGLLTRTLFSVWESSTVNNIRASFDDQESNNAAVTDPVASSRPVELNVDGTPKMYFHVVTGSATDKASFLATIAAPPVLTAHTDADLPETLLVGSFAALDGFLFIATRDGSIWNFDLNSDTAITATSFLDSTTQQYGRGVFNYKDKIGLFSEETIEFYENVGNPIGSPLQRIDQLTLRSYGLSLSNSTSHDPSQWYLAALDTVFWINNPRLGNHGVYMLDGFKPVKISSPDVDLDLTLSGQENQKIISTFELYGMRYLAINPGDTATQYIWVYCLDLGTWTTWESPIFTGAVNPAMIYNSHVSTEDENLTHALVGATIYRVDTQSPLYSDISYVDDSQAYTATIQTRVLDFGTNNRKRFKSLSLLGPDSRETSNCTVTTSIDDGQNFGNSRTIDLNTDDRRIFRQGVARRIQWRIAHSDDAPMDLEELEVDYEDLGR